MTTELASGFLSYARSDDLRENGRITRLAKKIMNEFETLTGEKLKLFIDRDDIEWGDGMRRSLDQALQETTFFIPILTPAYFLSDECRKEMLSFVSSAKSLGLEELLMSIRYVRVSDMREDSTDELKSVAAAMQYEDWTELRLADEEKSEYLVAVNRLAQRLVDLTHALEEKPSTSTRTNSRTSVSTVDDEDDDPDAPGLIDLIASFQSKADAWMETLQELPEAMNGFTAPFNAASADMSKHSGRDAFAYRITRSRQLASEVEDPLARYEQLSKDYATRLAELDPRVKAFLELSELVDESNRQSAIQTGAFDSLMKLVDSSRHAIKSTAFAADQARKLSRTSRDLRPVLRRFEVATRNFADAQPLIDGWADEIVDRGLAKNDDTNEIQQLIINN